MSGNFRGFIIKELIDFDDDQHVATSPYDIVYPVTLTDAIFDKAGNSSDKKSLTQILNELRKQIEEGPKNWEIQFPVTTVNGRTGDIILSKDAVGLSKVDNTPDWDKIMSDRQKEWVRNFVNPAFNHRDKEFNAFKKTYEDHCSNDNPHGLTADKLDETSNESLRKFINTFITGHNESLTAHQDIREDIANTARYIDAVKDATEANYIEFQRILTEHTMTGGEHHKDTFAEKENVANKVQSIISEYTENNGVLGIYSNITEHHYPSTKAMVDYFQQQYAEKIESITLDNLTYVKDLFAVDNSDGLPTASATHKGEIYVISKSKEPLYLGNTTFAKCIPHGDGYRWQEYLMFKQITLDEKYFETIGATNIWTFKPDAPIVANITFDWTHVNNTYALGYRLNNGTVPTNIFTLNDFAVAGADTAAYTRLAETLLDTGALNVLKFSYVAVDTLPAIADADTNKIYLLRDRNSASNIYTEYIVANGKWEAIGTTAMEFDNFLKKDDLMTIAEVDQICTSLGMTPAPAA